MFSLQTKSDLMLPGVVRQDQGGEPIEGIQKGQKCAITLVGSRYIEICLVVCIEQCTLVGVQYVKFVLLLICVLWYRLHQGLVTTF